MLYLDMKALRKALWSGIPDWLAWLLAGVFIFRIPSFLEPFYYGDEMIYLDLGEGIRRGLTLYRDVHDNKPPFLYYIAAISGNVFWFRVILAFWMIGTVIIFWYLAKKLFKNKNVVVASTILFAVLTSLPFFEGHVANAELFMIAPTLLACIFALKEKNIVKNSLLAGVFLGVASLFKIPAIFDGGVILLIWILYTKFTRHGQIVFLSRIVAFCIGVGLVLGLFFVWYAMRGAFNEYLIAAFLQNFGYVSSWRPSGEEQSFLVKNGPLLLRGAIAGISFIVLWLFRNKRSTGFLICCAMLVTGLFAATLSERPYPHYFIQVLPALAFLGGLLFASQTIEQVLVVLPLTAAFFVPVYFGFWQYSTSHYFGRFATLVKEGRGDKYFSEFGKNISRDYSIAKVVAAHTGPSESVFVWGDAAAIYALSRRLPPIKYVANYHISDFSSKEETYANLAKNLPKIIVVLPEAEPFNELDTLLTSGFVVMSQIDGATIWYNTEK